ncbi:LytTR family transcriptional regulator [Bacteroides caecigallinarum]|uniref:LytR/AlgR family response regulator transcription factor n=1 Tax=Bacteroides caecigallinarum TaxID=1411144 RepID=UPI00195CD743|nr:LytTR family DNA-binding domain-containing protein [Bacteroides caecigallinarum]MBM6866513.1 LytTR family transcriptional regulator [Bacteroides caecigallinarum]
MKQSNQELVIILPESMENIPVKIIRSELVEEFMVKFIHIPSVVDTETENGNYHVAIFNHDYYEHISMKDITWIEALGSYCQVNTTVKRKFTLSFPLGHIQKSLPAHIFIRINRSYLVNINHIKHIRGNSVMIDGIYLKIGKSYRKQVLDRFVFLGVRNKPE